MLLKLFLLLLIVAVIICTTPQNDKASVSKASSNNLLPSTTAWSSAQLHEMRTEVEGMFKHAFTNYMAHAFPDDELKPLSCSGRRREGEGRGKMDEVLGNYSLTLIDSLHSLLVFHLHDDFQRAVHFVAHNVSFDLNVTVNVFEVNIRVLGGLLSGHMLANEFIKNGELSLEYNGELLSKAVDLGTRLLPAFLTPTGIPYSRINLKYGVEPNEDTSTCLAGAGTLILEFGALSRLSGYSVFETAAKGALLALYKRRWASNLVPGSIDVVSGTWLDRTSSIGAGSDSFYEYLFKAYVLFGEPEYYNMFTTLYRPAVSAMQKAHWYFGVDTSTKDQRAYHIDSLQAFWPGLQAQIGEIDLAIEGFARYYAVCRKFKFLPEKYYPHLNSPDTAVDDWPLRPEYIESAYHLYRATRNPFFLQVGKAAVTNIQAHCKVACGFASVGTLDNSLDDRMDSYFLSETLMYLYLLFDAADEHWVHQDNYLFTTEGHLFPVKLLASVDNNYLIQDECAVPPARISKKVAKIAKTWPKLVGDNVLQDNVNTNKIETLISGMKVIPHHAVVKVWQPDGTIISWRGSSSAIGPGFPLDTSNTNDVTYLEYVFAVPANGCSALHNNMLEEGQHATNKIVLIRRGGCTFAQKVRWAQEAGAQAAVIVDDSESTSPLYITMVDTDVEMQTNGEVMPTTTSAPVIVTIPSTLITNGNGKFLQETPNCKLHISITQQPVVLVDGILDNLNSTEQKLLLAEVQKYLQEFAKTNGNAKAEFAIEMPLTTKCKDGNCT